jgi:hypothetical protein
MERARKDLLSMRYIKVAMSIIKCIREIAVDTSSSPSPPPASEQALSEKTKPSKRRLRLLKDQGHSISIVVQNRPFFQFRSSLGQRNHNQQPAGTGAIPNSSPSRGRDAILSHCKLARLHKLFLPLVILIFCTLVDPVVTSGNQIAFAAVPTLISHEPGVFLPEPTPHAYARPPLGSIVSFILVAVSCVSAMAKSMLGSLMGVSSVLWFVMRNDSAIRPSLSWA